MPYKRAEYLRNIHKWDIVQDFAFNGAALEQKARCKVCELERSILKVKKKFWVHFVRYERAGMEYPRDTVPECEPHKAVDVTKTKVKLQHE
jgi:hypothetical protein